MLLFLYALLFGAQVFLGDTVSNIEYKECTCISGRLDTVKTKLSVPESFEHYNITPEYLPVAPNDYLEGHYLTAIINLGNFIPPLRTVDPNMIIYSKTKKDAYYTLLAIDFDGESNGQVFCSLINIQNAKKIFPTSGDVIAAFTPPIPPLRSGIHRQALLLYEQKGMIDPYQPELLKLSRHRVITNLQKFLESLGLDVPVAGNFYITELMSCDSTDGCRKTDDD